jgi:hypothetical protein
MAQKYPPLLIHPDLVSNLRAIQTKTVEGQAARGKLGMLLQSALQLEFATIPPYLSAAFSIKSDNEEISELIIRVAKEEMLHMTVVANLMNAIGIAPDIVGAVPDYPYDLKVLDPPLRLDLRSFSFELVEELFMHIETPEDPVEFPSPARLMAADAELPETIGQFYQEIIGLIKSDTIPDLFENAERDTYKQIEVAPNFRPVRYASNQDNHTYPLNEDINFIIKDKESAVRHLTWVVSQGEGASPFNPLDAEGIPGHYYRFESILQARYLVKDDNVPEGYSYSGGDLPFSSDGVHDFDTNAKVEDYADYRGVERQMKRFNQRYTEMIDNLQAAFNCPSPDQEQQAKDAYQESVDSMRSMPSAASNIVRTAEHVGIKAGIPFQYLPS